MNDTHANETGRFFIGLDIKAAWPEELPHGRLIAAQERHLTLAFLGTQPRASISSLFLAAPPPPFEIGQAGIFDECLFFPPTHHPRCVAWHVEWQTGKEPFLHYQKTLMQFLEAEGVIIAEKRPFTPHVTIARTPFYPRLWKEAFHPVPLIASAICLFESLGHSTYKSISRRELIEPIVEIEHTADTAFLIRASSYSDLYLHARLALSFLFTPFLGYGSTKAEFGSLDEVIQALNECIAITDSEIGCPLKAVSFHSNLTTLKPNIMEWEMIVDV